jgi:RimJ/RimL family protein N-acetyltransferase
LLAEMLDWAEERARNESAGALRAIAYEMLGPGTLSVPVLETDSVRISALEAKGYARVERHSLRFQYSLEGGVPEPVLPPGMRVRPATDVDAEERIDLHRDAWSVWGPSSATVGAYRQLRTAPGYDEELDIVVEHEGHLVSYGIGWADAETGIGIFEPTGTRPDYTGQGLMRAVLHEGMRRMKARGLHTARIATASVNDRAAKAYAGAGFELVEREWFWSKKMI